MDYWSQLEVERYVNYEDFLQRNPGAKIYICLLYTSIGHHHRALDDAKATYLLYERLEKEFGAVQADVFEPKPLIYKAKRQTPATARQKKHLKELADYHKINLNLEWETLTRNEASRQVCLLYTSRCV